MSREPRLPHAANDGDTKGAVLSGLVLLRRRLRTRRFGRIEGSRNSRSAVRICPLRHRNAAVRVCTGRCQPHSPRNKTSKAAAGCDSQSSRARSALQLRSRPRSLQLQRKQFSVGTSCHSGRHARHVVGDIERMLAICGLGRAVARGLELIVRRFDVETAAIGRTRSRELLQFLLHGIVRPGRSRRRRRGFVAADKACDCCQPEDNCFVHGSSIVKQYVMAGSAIVVPVSLLQHPISDRA